MHLEATFLYLHLEGYNEIQLSHICTAAVARVHTFSAANSNWIIKYAGIANTILCKQHGR